MTCREKLKKERPNHVHNEYCGGCFACPDDYDYLPKPLDCADRNGNHVKCTSCWDREIPETPTEDKTETPHIKDSGDRTEFETGAVRDMREGKGRCDLMALEVLYEFFGDHIFSFIEKFKQDHNTLHLRHALEAFMDRAYDGPYTMFLEVAKHFEEGAKKYGESNWQKGIPVKCYIDSAVRHYLKWLRGDKDEPHDRAFVWNLMCCIWEVDYSPRAEKEQE